VATQRAHSWVSIFGLSPTPPREPTGRGCTPSAQLGHAAAWRISPDPCSSLNLLRESTEPAPPGPTSGQGHGPACHELRPMPSPTPRRESRRTWLHPRRASEGTQLPAELQPLHVPMLMPDSDPSPRTPWPRPPPPPVTRRRIGRAAASRNPAGPRAHDHGRLRSIRANQLAVATPPARVHKQGAQGCVTNSSSGPGPIYPTSEPTGCGRPPPKPAINGAQRRPELEPKPNTTSRARWTWRPPPPPKERHTAASLTPARGHAQARPEFPNPQDVSTPPTTQARAPSPDANSGLGPPWRHSLR
jgi:hypothetical protein